VRCHHGPFTSAHPDTLRLRLVSRDARGCTASPGYLNNLQVQPGQSPQRAALIYQHAACGADQRITDAVDSHIQAEHGKDDDGGAAGVLVPAS
jgi:hypothetical protein